MTFAFERARKQERELNVGEKHEQKKVFDSGGHHHIMLSDIRSV